MTVERGHQSIYFRDTQVLKDLEEMTEKDLGDKVSVSAVVCEVLKQALPDIRRQVKAGKRQGIKVSFTVDIG